MARSKSVKRTTSTVAPPQQGSEELPEYLTAEFDPSKLTKPQLRSILGECGITNLPPANAKKEVLVDLFRTHISSRVKEILKARKGVKPSAEGIAFLDKFSHPSPRKAPSRSPSKSLVASRSSSPLARKGVTGGPLEVTEGKKIVGRGRRAAATNRGASPSPNKRRRTPSPPPSSPSRKINSPLLMLQESLPKFADSPAEVTKKLHDRLEFIASANKLRGARAIMSSSPSKSRSRSRSKSKTPDRRTRPKLGPISIDSASDISESSLSLYPGRPKRVRSVVGSHLSSLLSIAKIVFVTTLASFVALYVNFKFINPVKYCDNGAPHRLLFPKSWDVQEALSNIKEYCLPCPMHGQCSNGQITCDDSFVFTPNWISLGGICQTDIKKLSMIDDIVHKAANLLHLRAGQAKCGQIPEIGKVFTEAQISRELSSLYPNADWLREGQFDKLFAAALLELGRDPISHNVQLSQSAFDGMKLFQSTQPSLDLTCRVRLALFDFYFKHIYSIWITMLVVASVLAMIFYYRSKTNQDRKVEELVQAVIQILAEQDALNRRDPTTPSTISIHQIRDALFMRSPVRIRNRLWPLVCACISLNSNIRESIMSIKGEQHRVWEWIGSDVLSPLHALAPK